MLFLDKEIIINWTQYYTTSWIKREMLSIKKKKLLYDSKKFFKAKIAKSAQLVEFNGFNKDR